MKNKNNHSKTPTCSPQLRGRLLQFLMMCKLLQMFAHLASNTCMNLKREGEKSTLHIQRRSSSQQHLLNRAPRCLTLLSMTCGRITTGLFMHGMNKMCLVDAWCCSGKICQTAPSTVLWKTVSECVLRDYYFFCMSVLHLYNNKERKGKQSSNKIQSKHSAETDDTLLVWKLTDLTGVVVGVKWV